MNLVKTIKGIIESLVHWIEHGDLIPALLVVSIPHYAQVLHGYDFWWVATALGFLIDIGHYRTIKLFMRGKGWFWTAILTLFSAGFHITFYTIGGATGIQAIMLGLAPTSVIFALAYITRAERLDKEPVSKSQPKPTETSGTPNESQVELSKMSYSDYAAYNDMRPVSEWMTAAELEKSGISHATAFRWQRKYKESKNGTIATTESV